MSVSIYYLSQKQTSQCKSFLGRYNIHPLREIIIVIIITIISTTTIFISFVSDISHHSTFTSDDPSVTCLASTGT